MEAEKQSALIILVIWRGKKLNVEMESSDTLKEFGHKLQKLTNVKADTMRLLVPRSMDEGSKLFTPFSDEHSSLSLQEASIHERKPVRMMGVFEEEIEEIKQNAKADLRIVGFDEEEKRVRQKILDRPQTSLRLPQGTYTFCDFYTLQIPGIELNPPATEALRWMHMLAADPGIIAIMTVISGSHPFCHYHQHWRVGIMTEMAPEGYVGISPKCILGYNKNHREEISLRLRTDDRKGFRKYENIKKTLLHELLNEEAASLDWTRSRSRTLSAARPSERHEEEIYVGSSGNTSQKLGGKKPGQLASARAFSVAAAYHRLAIASTNCSGGFGDHVEPDPDDSGLIVHEPDPDDSVEESMQVDEPKEAGCNPYFEPDPDDSQHGEAIVSESFRGKKTNRITSEPDPDDCEVVNYAPNIGTGRKLVGFNTYEEPDSDDSVVSGTTKKRGVTVELRMDDAEGNGTLNSEGQLMNSFEEPNSDDCEVKQNILEYGNSDEPDPDDSVKLKKTAEEPDPDDSGTPLEHGSRNGPDPIDSRGNGVMQSEPHPDDTMKISMGSSRMQVDEPDPDDSVKLNKTAEEPDPDDSGTPLEHGSRSGPDPIDSRGNGGMQSEPHPDDTMKISMGSSRMQVDELDPDDSVKLNKTAEEPDPDDSGTPLEHGSRNGPDPIDSQGNGVMQSEPRPDDTMKISMGSSRMQVDEPDPDDSDVEQNILEYGYSDEPDPDDSVKLNKTAEELDPDDSGTPLEHGSRSGLDPIDSRGNGVMQSEPHPDDTMKISMGSSRMQVDEPDPDDSVKLNKTAEEPDPDDSGTPLEHGSRSGPDAIDSQGNGVMQSEPRPDDTMKISMGSSRMQVDEPDPDDSDVEQNILEYGYSDEPDPDDSVKLNKTAEEPDPDDSRTPLEHGSRSGLDPIDSRGNGVLQSEPHPDDTMKISMGSSRMQVDEPDPDDLELQRIQDPVSVVCAHLQKAIEMLQSQVSPTEATTVLQTLFKIIRNVIKHPDEMKFRRLRKANPLFQQNITNYRAAMGILFLVGVNEDVVSDEVGRAETNVVLKRNDLGLLWLAKSSLEMCIAY